MFSVTILGNNSAIPAHDRHPTAQVVDNEEQSFLIDCGEGTQMQMRRYKIRTSRINNIFISHLHGDHYFGLIGLLTSMALLGRKTPISLYAPSPLIDIINMQLQVASAILPYVLNFVPLENEGVLYEDKKISVSGFEVFHRIRCFGFIFTEKKHLRKIDPIKVKEHEIPFGQFEDIMSGKDFIRSDHTIVKNELLTYPNLKPKCYVFCGDTKYHKDVAAKIKGADLLYHESTYLHHLQEKAASRFHSTSKEAAVVARDGGVTKLLLGHFSSQYDNLNPFLEEAKDVFPNTEIAEEGVTYLI